jgi:hypothetical protein
MANEFSNVYIFKNHSDAEVAVRTLAKSGFDMKHLSVIGRGFHTEEQPIGFYTMGDRVRTWGKFGVFWGAIWGLIVSPAIFVLPKVGLLAMAGPVVAALVSALEGAVVVGGLTALSSALVGLGVDKNQVIKYEVAIKADKYLMIVHGSNQEVEHARSVLKELPIQRSDEIQKNIEAT